MNFSPKKWTKNHFINIILPLGRKIKEKFSFRELKSIKKNTAILCNINKNRTPVLRVLSKNSKVNHNILWFSYSINTLYWGYVPEFFLRRQNQIIYGIYGKIWRGKKWLKTCRKQYGIKIIQSFQQAR